MEPEATSTSTLPIARSVRQENIFFFEEFRDDNIGAAKEKGSTWNAIITDLVKSLRPATVSVTSKDVLKIDPSQDFYSRMMVMMSSYISAPELWKLTAMKTLIKSNTEHPLRAENTTELARLSSRKSR